ncbi:MAG: tetratricopeptide repeat protein [Bryobacteraceae bacterium]|jgi:tetratricopeptide (TPR) repeat protein
MIARRFASSLLVLAWPALLGQANAPMPSAGPTAVMSRMAQAVFLSGSVQLDDGTPPPEPVVIQRICGSMTRNEAWTDRKGRFSFQVGGGQPMMADASLDGSGNNRSGLTQYQVQAGGVPTSELVSASSLIGCDLRTQMPGYRSDVLHLDRRGLLEKGEVGTIVLHRLGNVEGLTVSATTVAAPKESAKAYQKGLKEAARQHFDKARAAFESAVKGYPNYAVAWIGLGLACEQMNDAAAAIRAYTEASRADAKLLKPHERLTVLADQSQRWADSARYSAEWIRLDPVDFPNAWLLNAVANIRLNKLEEAEHSAREGLRLDKEGRFPRIRYVLGYVLAAKNELGEAVAYFHDYLTMEPNGSDARVLRGQLPGLEQAAAAARNPKE